MAFGSIGYVSDLSEALAHPRTPFSCRRVSESSDLSTLDPSARGRRLIYRRWPCDVGARLLGLGPQPAPATGSEHDLLLRHFDGWARSQGPTSHGELVGNSGASNWALRMSVRTGRTSCRHLGR